MSGSPEFVTTLTVIDNASKALESIEASAKRAADVFDLLVGIEHRLSGFDRPIGYISDGMSRIADKAKDAEDAVRDLDESLGDMSDTAKKFSLGDMFGSLISNGANIFGMMQMASGVLDQFQGMMSTVDANTNMIARLGQVARNEGIAMEDTDAWKSRAEEIRKMLSEQATDLGLDATDYANNAITFANNPAFKGIEEASRFSELMSKQFFASGVGGQAQMSVINQLTQGLSKGRLQGEDLMSILSNAPDVGKLLEEAYARLNNLDVSEVTGKVRELAVEGKLTADVIKDAFFGAAETIEANFEEMPNTFEDMLTKFRNTVFESFQPIMQLMMQIGNSDSFKSMLSSVSSVIGSVVQVANTLSPVLELALDAASATANVLDVLIGGVLSPLSWFGKSKTKETPGERTANYQRYAMLREIEKQTAALGETTRAIESLNDLQKAFNERQAELYSYSDAYAKKTEEYLKNYQFEHVEAAVQEALKQNPGLDNFTAEFIREGASELIAQGSIFNEKQYQEARQVYSDVGRVLRQFEDAIADQRRNSEMLESAISAGIASGDYSNLASYMEQQKEVHSLLRQLESTRVELQSQLDSTGDAMNMYRERMSEWLKRTAENTGKTAKNTRKISIDRDDLLFMRNIATAQIINNYNNNTNTANFNQSFGGGSAAQIRRATSDGWSRALRGTSASI